MLNSDIKIYMLRKLGICIVILLAISSLLVAAEPMFHVVRKGETLSEIAVQVFGKPLYSKNGSLKKIKSLNPQILNIDIIHPGQQIFFGPVMPQQQTVQISSEFTSEHKPEEPTGVAKSPLSNITACMGFNFFRIDSNDKSTGDRSALLSNMSPSFHFNWDLGWNEEWTSRLGFKAENFKILNEAALSPITLNASSGTRFGFEFGVFRHWSEASRTGALLSYEEKIFVHSPTTNSLTIDRVGTPTFSLYHEQDIFSLKVAKLGLGAEVQGFFPGTGPAYTTQFGYGGRVYTYLNHNLKRISFLGILSYGYEQQNSTLTEQSRSQLGASFGVSWRFGE